MQLPRWRNSAALHLPLFHLQEMSLQAGSMVNMKVESGRFITALATAALTYALEELLEGITPDNFHAEVSTGSAVGAEFP